jgi:nicotinate-nucleotide pyrophosphorylase (carboxylating)
MLHLDEMIRDAFEEDLPNGDLTTDTLFKAPIAGRARLIAKEDLVLSHTEIFEKCVRSQAPETKFKWEFKNGDFALEKQTVCVLQGDLVAILKAERVALNFLGKLSGIATLTRCFVNQVKHTKTKILDTRKTTPLYRTLEKEAVVNGGGVNHRMNLSSAVLIKENHIRAAGGIKEAVSKFDLSATPVEIECSTIEEVKIAVDLRVQRILLDNMDNETLKAACALIPTFIKTEASGNMKLERVGSVAEIGVDFISVGALTHSAATADYSLLFEW